MVEGGAKQLPEDEVLAALKHAHNADQADHRGNRSLREEGR